VSFSRYIAKRYFFAKSSSNAVNIITAISLVGILVGSAALIIVLSAFNGLENLVRGFYQDFDPDLKVLPLEGKFFDEQEALLALSKIPELIHYTAVLEEKALFNFREKDFIATIKGVDEQYLTVNALDEHIPYGAYFLENSPGINPVIMGAGVAYYLGFGTGDLQSSVNLFIPKDIGKISNESFRSERVNPVGVFSIQPDFDEKYVLARLDFTRKLLNREGQVSAIEITVAPDADFKSVQKKIMDKLGDNYLVLTSDELQAGFIKVMRTEGLFTFLIFALILSIATFTIAGSLTMIMFEKRGNLFTLWSMGVPIVGLRQIILKLGLLISLSGGLVGIALGSLVVWAQEYFQLISVGEGYIVDAYPVSLQGQDIILVTCTVLGLGFLSSWLSARRLNLALLKA
jgi:lipoprotein-releasing system permease protein